MSTRTSNALADQGLLLSPSTQCGHTCIPLPVGFVALPQERSNRSDLEVHIFSCFFAKRKTSIIQKPRPLHLPFLPWKTVVVLVAFLRFCSSWVCLYYGIQRGKHTLIVCDSLYFSLYIWYHLWGAEEPGFPSHPKLGRELAWTLRLSADFNFCPDIFTP